MYICIMENDYLKAIASVVLPAQILDYFIVVGVEQTKTEIHISLDECNNKDLSKTFILNQRALWNLSMSQTFP